MIDYHQLVGPKLLTLIVFIVVGRPWRISSVTTTNQEVASSSLAGRTNLRSRSRRRLPAVGLAKAGIQPAERATAGKPLRLPRAVDLARVPTRVTPLARSSSRSIDANEGGQGARQSKLSTLFSAISSADRRDAVPLWRGESSQSLSGGADGDSVVCQLPLGKSDSLPISLRAVRRFFSIRYQRLLCRLVNCFRNSHSARAHRNSDSSLCAIAASIRRISFERVI